MIEAPSAEAQSKPWHEFYFTAWERLRFDRTYGAAGGQTPIPFSAYDRYADRYSITGDQFDVFLAFMTAVDAAWLDEVAKRAPKPENQ